MKHVTLALMGAMVLSAPAFARDYDNDVAEEREELRESQRSVDKDNADIRRHQKTLEQNRAEKARAKAEGDVGRQAYESMAISANKVAIKKNEAERYIGRKMVEEDREDLREERAENYGDRNTRRGRNVRDLSPSAGSQSTFLGMRSENTYPGDARHSQSAHMEYWYGNRSRDSRY